MMSRTTIERTGTIEAVDDSGNRCTIHEFTHFVHTAQTVDGSPSQKLRGRREFRMANGDPVNADASDGTDKAITAFVDLRSGRRLRAIKGAA
jgi:hypothetical protein